MRGFQNKSDTFVYFGTICKFYGQGVRLTGERIQCKFSLNESFTSESRLFLVMLLGFLCYLRYEFFTSLAGNGVSDEYHVIRHVMNLEAVNTYEGRYLHFSAPYIIMQAGPSRASSGPGVIYEDGAWGVWGRSTQYNFSRTRP